METPPYRIEVFIEQLEVVNSFWRHLLYYRALKECERNSKFSPFWVSTTNAHLLQACIFWWMAFGNSKTNKTHWHHLATSKPNSLRESFSEGLCNHLAITRETWNSYWKEMQSFRDQYAAHRDLGDRKPVPHFDKALEAAFYFDVWVRDLIAPDILEAPSMRDAYETERTLIIAEISAAITTSGKS